MKDSQDWLDEILEEFGLDDRYNFEDRLHDRITDDEMCEQYEAFYNKAKSAIRKHILQEANEARIDEVNRYDVDEDAYKALRLAELRNKFNDKYKGE